MAELSRKDVDRRVYELRARESGRGRAACSVFDIPLAGWRDILTRVFRQIEADQVGLTAAGVTFYTVLAMFPAMVLLVSVYGLVTDAATITRHISLLEGIMPPSAIDLIAAELERITSGRNEGLGLAAIVAFLFTCWTAGGAVRAMFVAMNVAYDEAETRGFFSLAAITLAFTLAGVLVLVIVANFIVLVPLAFDFLGLTAVGQLIAAVLPSALIFAILFLAISALYRFGPSRRGPRVRWLGFGAALSTVLVLAVSVGFSFYLANWGDYGATYGSLGTAIGLMMWIYLTSFIVILGAELNAEIERQTAEDTTIGPERPLGERRAFVADTVGERS